MEISTRAAASILGLMTRLAYRNYQGIDPKDRVEFVARAAELMGAVFPPLAETGPWFAVRIRMSDGWSGTMVMAIKALREITGVGLREARDVVERGWSLVVANAEAAQAVTEHMAMEIGKDIEIEVEKTDTMPEHRWAVSG